MKNILIAIVMLFATIANAGELRLELYGDELKGKSIRVAVYSSVAAENFLSEEKVYRGFVNEAMADNITLTVPDLPPGVYAVAVYADDNRNGMHDKNFLGIPTEMYGISNNARSMFGPPVFSQAQFEVGAEPVAQSIHIH